MIPLADLAETLSGAQQIGQHELRLPCPKCGAKATIRDFGARRSFRCETCGTLEEGDFSRQPKGASADLNPTAAQVLDTASGKAQPSHTEALNGAGGGRPHRGREKTHPDKALVPSRGISAADDILKRKPPQDIEAEQSVLGAILLDNEAIAKIGWLSAESFYRESHREIYRAFLSLRSTGDPIDAITLAAVLRARGHFESVGGASYIAELATVVPTALNIDTYAAIVRDKAINREVILRATKVVSLGYDGVTGDALIGEMERLLKPLAEGERAVVPFPEPLTASQWYAREAQLYSRVTWVWDNILEGGGISVLAGKKGAGKSTFVRTLMLAAARGWALLGRNMQASRIWYIDMEPGGSARKALMEQLGWNDDDQLHISTGSPMAGKPGLFEWLKATIVANRYQMVVVDTMYKLLKIEGTNDYDKGIYGQVPIEEICRETGCHFMLIHHARKNPSPGALSSIAEEILGSVSVAATAGTVMLIRKRAQVSTFQMDPPRYGEAIEGEIVLKKIESTGWVEEAGSWGNAWMADAKTGILAALEDRTGWTVPRDLDVMDRATGQTLNERTKKWLLGKMADANEVQKDGRGVTGDPFRYQKVSGTEPPRPKKEPRQKGLKI